MITHSLIMNIVDLAALAVNSTNQCSLLAMNSTTKTLVNKTLAHLLDIFIRVKATVFQVRVHSRGAYRQRTGSTKLVEPFIELFVIGLECSGEHDGWCSTHSNGHGSINRREEFSREQIQCSQRTSQGARRQGRVGW